jgi:hypothetical protein
MSLAYQFTYFLVEVSGFIEGINNKLKVLIKQCCYELFNLKHLFQHIFYDMGGYRLFACGRLIGVKLQ